jgi:hypothetical protein
MHPRRRHRRRRPPVRRQRGRVVHLRPGQARDDGALRRRRHERHRLGYDGDIDVRFTTNNDSVVQVNGGGGADFIDATGVRYHTVQLGEAGNDMLIGGVSSDGLDGGSGQDTFLTKDGIAESVKGGTESDTGTFDFNLDQLTSIERPGF